MTQQRSSRATSFPRGRAANKSARHHISHPPRHRRLRVEPLEDRRLLAVFTVDNLNDAGTGSLRQAIDDANAAVGADTVEFQAGLAGTIALSTGEMTITDDLTIDGPGAGMLMIDAQQNSRIFHITPASGPVTFEGLQLTGGNVMGNGGAILSETSALLSIQSSTISGNLARFGGLSPGDRGGGIHATGDVTISGSTITDNLANASSSGAAGGGVYALGDLTITGSTISGNSARGRSAKGGGIDAKGVVTVTGSTISGNSARGTSSASGGGIHAQGEVAVTNSTISGNAAGSLSFATGGGIRARAGAATVTNSTISGNSATGNVASAGGGIYAGRILTVTHSTISGNAVTGGSDSIRQGAGILARGDLTVTHSAISDNVATAPVERFGGARGGGIMAYADVTISNSTISGNSAVARFSIANGGGIFAFGRLTVTGSTISGNLATGGRNGIGGGVWVRDTPVTIENSIIAGNHSVPGIAPDLNPGTGPLTVHYSLIGDNTDTGLAETPVGMPDANGNLIGTSLNPIDPLLGPLQDNGGPTFTHALLPGSPAINAGDPAFAPPPDFDQRGDPFVRVFDGRIDMGAFEWQPVSLDQRIQQLLDDGVLNRGQANSLLVKLNPAGNERAQINRLSAFINEVNALIRAGILSAAEGQKLIDGAESLQMSLSVDMVLPLLVGRR